MKVLRVVTLASKSGRYGGPSDTSIRQAEISPANVSMRVLAGALKGDEREHPLLQTVHVRQWVPRAGYSGLFSLGIAKRIVDEVKYSDVVHVSIARELIPIFAATVAAVQRKPLILQPHGMLTGTRGKLHRLVDKAISPILSRAIAFIALTDIEARQIEACFQIDSRKIQTIGNPSQDVRAFRSKSSDVPYALFAARLHPRKRVVDFLAAAEIAAAQSDDTQYLVAGPDQGDLALVEQASIKNANVKYLGALSVDRLNRYLAGAGVFVLTSRDEPWGNVLAAAIRAGIPVVVTASSALAADVKRLGAGYVVEDENPRQIREAIEGALKKNENAWMPTPEVESIFGDEGIRTSLATLYEVPQEIRPGSARPYAN